MPEAPRVTIVGTSYVVTWEEFRLRLTGHRISEHARSVHAEVTVDRLGDTAQYMRVKHSMLNLLSERSISSLAKSCAQAVPIPDADGWQRILDQFATQVVSLYRRPDPSYDLAREEPRPAQLNWLVEPFIEEHAITVLFGPGGSGKSALGLGMAMTAAGAPIIGSLAASSHQALYLDWEATRHDQAWTYRALLNGYDSESPGPLVSHKRMRVPFRDAVSSLAQEIAEKDIGLIVIDSMMIARGSDPNEAGGTVEFFAALDVLPCAKLIIDHVSKDQMDKAPGTRQHPFGTIVTENTARHTWSVKAIPNDAHGKLQVLLTHEKANRGKTGDTRGYELTFGDMSIEVAPLDQRDMPGLDTDLPTADRVLRHLEAKGGDFPQAISEALDINDSTVRTNLKRLVNRGKIRKNPDGGYGLAAPKHRETQAEELAL